MSNNFETNDNGGWVVPNKTTIPVNTVIPSYSILGYECVLGNGCRLGDRCSLGSECRLGDRCSLGDRCRWLNLEVSRWLTIANVDGSGRVINIVQGADGNIKIEAGCFCGTVDEFVDRAKKENKHI